MIRPATHTSWAGQFDGRNLWCSAIRSTRRLKEALSRKLVQVWKNMMRNSIHQALVTLECQEWLRRMTIN